MRATKGNAHKAAGSGPVKRPGSGWLRELLIAGAIYLAGLFLLAPFSDFSEFTRRPLLDPAGVLQVYPWLLHNAHEFKLGHFPLWNPYTALGQPHLGNLQTAVFFPLYWPWLAAGGSESAYGALLGARLFLAAMFWFVFARKKLFGFAGALVTGAVYGLNSYCLWFMQLLDLNSQMLLPLLCLSLSGLMLRPRLRVLLASAALVALALFGGHPAAAFVTVFVASLYAYCAFFCERGFSRLVFSRTLVLAAAGVIALMFCAAALVPFMNYLSRSWSLHSPGFGFFHLDPRGFFNLVLPGAFARFLDMPREIPVEYINLSSWQMFRLPYSETAVPGNLPAAGPLVCLLAVLGAVRARRWPILFFLGIFALLGGLTFGLPGFRLIAFIPPFDVNSNFKFFFSELHAAIAVLAGAGVEQLIRAGRARKSLLTALVLMFIFVQLGVNSLHVRPFVLLERPRGDDRQELLDELARRLGPESRLTGFEDYWPANQAMKERLKDVRSSDALFYRPYVDLLNRVNNLSAEEGLGYFYPSYFMRPSPDRMNSPASRELGAALAVSSKPWLPESVIDQAVGKARGLYGVAPPARTLAGLETQRDCRFPSVEDETCWPALFLHAPAMISFEPRELSGRGPEARSATGVLSFLPVIGPAESPGDGATFAVMLGESPPRLAYLRHLLPGEFVTDIETWPPLMIEGQASEPITLSTLPGPRGNFEVDWSRFAGLSWHEGSYRPPPEPVWSAGPAGPRLYALPHLPWAHFADERAPLPSERLVNDLVKIRADGRPGRLIVREAWYPGWELEVDGEKTALIIPADKASWQAELAGGADEIVFRFRPADFRIGLFVSLAAALLSCLILSARRKKTAP